jgi:hypothetical protein
LDAKVVDDAHLHNLNEKDFMCGAVED